MRKAKRQEQIEKSAKIYGGLLTYYPWVIRYVHGVYVVCREEASRETGSLLRDSAWVGRWYPIARFMRWFLNKREGY